MAQAVGSRLAVYAAAEATAVPLRWLDPPAGPASPIVVLVAEQRKGWLRVYLPVRPNGSTGWVRAQDVEVSSDAYHITVQLASHRLVVVNGSALVMDEPIGVGTHLTPTPGGVYYLTELLKTPDPAGPYGPYAYGLSGFSSVLSDFAGGDGVIGIHGTNQPEAIGRDVSHGCIRLRNAAIERLVPLLPLGTPVSIR